MAEPVEEVLRGYVAQALELRLLTELPGPQAAPTDTVAFLLEVRHRLDRVEDLLSRAMRVRGRAARAASLATATVDDAWDTAVHRGRTAPVQRGDEYSSARERHAEANLAVLDLRHAARAAATTAHTCDEAVEVIRLAHRGLDGVRHDVLAVLRALQWESTMER